MRGEKSMAVTAELRDVEVAGAANAPEGFGEGVLHPLLEGADDLAVVAACDAVPVPGFQGSLLLPRGLRARGGRRWIGGPQGRCKLS
jgi:hypothetical protein